MKYVIYRNCNGSCQSVMIVRTEERAVELCAIWEDMDAEYGVSYSYKKEVA